MHKTKRHRCLQIESIITIMIFGLLELCTSFIQLVWIKIIKKIPTEAHNNSKTCAQIWKLASLFQVADDHCELHELVLVSVWCKDTVSQTTLMLHVSKVFVLFKSNDVLFNTNSDLSPSTAHYWPQDGALNNWLHWVLHLHLLPRHHSGYFCRPFVSWNMSVKVL